MTTPGKPLRAVALALPLLFLAAACDDDDENGTGPTATLQVEATLDGNGGLVIVTDGGTAVTGADVSVNGTAGVAGATDGEYTVTLPAPVAVGGAVTLDVDDGNAVVQGAGIVPEAPVITAPADGADVTSGDDVEVTWTSTADPDGWTLVATSGGSTVTSETTDGALRVLTIDGATLADGDWTIQVFAVNNGVLSGDLEAGSSMFVRAGAAASPTITVGPPLLLIRGTDMGPEFNHVSLTLGGVVVDGATVTVNGEAAVQPAAGQNYDVQLAVPVDVGDQLDLDVTVGAEVYQGLGNVPEPPAVTLPADAAVFVVADAIQVDWTSTADPDRFAIFVDGPTPYQNIEIAGNLRTFTIPAGTFTAGAYTISVFSYEDGTFTGPAHADSRMSIRGSLGPFPGITVNP